MPIKGNFFTAGNEREINSWSMADSALMELNADLPVSESKLHDSGL
jgi:hypothetical protein